MLTFNGLLQSQQIDAAKTRLVRHKHRTAQGRLYHDAVRRDARFEQYQAVQANPAVIRQLEAADVIASFVVDLRGNTVFVGLWTVHGSRIGYMPDAYSDLRVPTKRQHVVFDFERHAVLDEYIGRLVIDWGGGERAWVQYAHRQDKKIIELRRVIEEPRFPGFAHFAWNLAEVAALPPTWLEPLRTTRGVYLLVHRSSGSQYVGSAIGSDGFLGRWRGYVGGHGGNVGLKELGSPASEFDVSILETAGSAASPEDIYGLETLWKVKLGSRATGLNRN